MSVTTYLMGGVGNTLFQYAAGLALARRLGTSLYLDGSRYDSPSEFRMYSMGLFKGIDEVRVAGMSGRVIREQGLPYNPSLLADAQGDVTLYGYWQCEKYFQDVEQELRDRIQPRLPVTDRALALSRTIHATGDRSVFLTIRRTDYVGNDFHGVLPLEYYEAALKIVAERFPDPHVFVFTDDVLWVEQSLRLPYRTTIGGNFDRTVRPHLGREDEELWLMSLCHNAVMANSSYSWWGAWLSPFDRNKRRIVVAPKAWFGTKGTEDPRDIVPDRWMTI